MSDQMKMADATPASAAGSSASAQAAGPANGGVILASLIIVAAVANLNLSVTQPDVIVFLAGAGLIVLVIVFPLAAELGKRASART